jgi:hypothetical protein
MPRALLPWGLGNGGGRRFGHHGGEDAMRKLGAWGLGLALILGTFAAVRGDDDDGDDPAPKPAKSSPPKVRFGHPKPPEKKPVPKPEEKKVEKPPVQSSMELAIAERRREEEALFRRLEVCDRLRKIADSTNDQELNRLADQLTERAQATYAQRVAHLPASNAAFGSDEQVLEKHLGQPAAERSAITIPPGRVKQNEGGQTAALEGAKP